MRLSRPLLALLFLSLAISIPARSQTQPEVFNVNTYLGTYPDLMNVYGQDTTDAQNHWTCCGITEGRRASVIFDPVYYLNHNSDLLAAFGPNGYYQALNHFINQGLPVEGRRGSLEFDVRYYLARYSDLAAAYGTNYLQAADHFLIQGLPVEGRRGSADFDIRAYINIYPDVAAAYGNDYTDAMLHWLRRGKAAGRVGVGAPFVSTECGGATPAGFSRIYIGAPTSGSGNGTASNPFDGTTAVKFDGLLRSISEQTAPIPINPETGTAYGRTNLIVCLAGRTFQTYGSWDWVVARHTLSSPPGTAANPGGFTVNQNWHIHGAGPQTVIQLTAFLANPPADFNFPPNTGLGQVFATFDDNSSGVEISDLTIDGNYPNLKPVANNTGITAINLVSMLLRSNTGGYRVHRVNVINNAGEVGRINVTNEAFPINIQSETPTPGDSTRTSTNSVIEYVTMSNFGAHSGTAITLGNANAEIRYNYVNGADIGYGGWDMGAAYFHDNFAVDCTYGFNIDSLTNNGTSIQFNDINFPRHFGIVIGGGGTYTRFWLLYNTIRLYDTMSRFGTTSIGLVLQGNVTTSVFARTNFLTTASNIAIDARGSANAGNAIQYNQISNGLDIEFDPPSYTFQNCIFGNWDEFGTPRSDFPDNIDSPCVDGL
jgi:hypothetical protein